MKFIKKIKILIRNKCYNKFEYNKNGINGEIKGN
jgi:hypothetical protein